MNKCPFYREEVRHIKSKEIRPDRQALVSVIKIPWCNHKHSPVSQKIAANTLGGGNLLKCEADFSKCQVAVEKRADL